MKKFICITLAFCCSFALQAQVFCSGPTYTLPEGDLLKVLRLQNSDYRTITLSGDFGGRTARLAAVAYIDSLPVSRDEVRFGIAPNLDTLCLTVLMQVVGRDSVRVVIGDQAGAPFLAKDFSIRTDNRILMETYPPAGLVDTAAALPVIAFASGIEKQMEFRGQIGTMIDFCGLRDANVAPAEWGERFGLKDYIYWELRIE